MVLPCLTDLLIPVTFEHTLTYFIVLEIRPEAVSNTNGTSSRHSASLIHNPIARQYNILSCIVFFGLATGEVFLEWTTKYML